MELEKRWLKLAMSENPATGTIRSTIPSSSSTASQRSFKKKYLKQEYNYVVKLLCKRSIETKRQGLRKKHVKNLRNYWSNWNAVGSINIPSLEKL
jgi:hypothetical protein